MNLASPKADFLARSRDASSRRCSASLLGIPYLIFHLAPIWAPARCRARAVADSLDHASSEPRPGRHALLEVKRGRLVRGLPSSNSRRSSSASSGPSVSASASIPATCWRPVRHHDTQVRIDDRRVRSRHRPRCAEGDPPDAAKRASEAAWTHARWTRLPGIEVFRRIVNDARFADPMVLETPGGLDAWREELALLRSLTS